MKTLIISDLHLGNGGPYDVFEGGEALPALLDSVAGAGVRVLVNGDGVDFLLNEDPLELDEARAVAQARAIAQHPSSAAVFAAFGRALARGGEVTVRLGNHDVELALPAVQEVFRQALAVPPEIARRLAFARGDAPEILEVGGARVLVTHGEQNDDWNRVDYPKLVAKDAKYQYAPGSALVKQILNPGVRAHGMRFLSLLKPDFQGAALSALAVDPSVAKQILKGSSVRMLASLRARKDMALTFDEEEAAGPDDGLSARLGEVGLSDDERDVLASVLDEGSALSFSDEDEGILRKARAKIARKALAAYVGLQRKLTGAEGDTYFELDPAGEEWTEAQRLAAKYEVAAVIIGHTHAARFRQDEGLLYANTGTWIGLMRLPAASAPDETWLAFLEELRQNKALLPEKQKLAAIERRFTAALLEPHAEGGAALSLVEWKDGALQTLRAGRVPPAA